MRLAAPEHQDMNGKVEVTWRMLCIVAQSLMVYARVLAAYIHFALMYTTDNIFPVLPIKDKATQTYNRYKTISITFTRFFCPCVVRKAMAHVETKVLNMCHQAQKVFRGIFVGILEHQKGYLVYVNITRKILSSYNGVFDESFLVC